MSRPSSLFRSIFLVRSSKYLFCNSPIRPYSKSLTSSYMSHLICPKIARRMSSTATAPWLMLPPDFDGGGAVGFNFYSLAENKVITLPGSGEKEITDALQKPNNHFDFNFMIRGSSHGWLALSNQRNLDLFLYNPISRRHIKLPPIHNLPVRSSPPGHLRRVIKLILSCSPDDENCRAVMTYDCDSWLAFCCPGRSKEWTLIGGTDCRDETDCWDEDGKWSSSCSWMSFLAAFCCPGRTHIGGTHCRDEDGKRFSSCKSCEDFVYSSEQELFFCLTNDGHLETLDLRDPSSPRIIMSREFDGYNFRHWKDLEDIVCRNHLVVADHHLLVVTRFIMLHVGPGGSYVNSYDVDEDWEYCDNCPHLTFDFVIHKYDPEKGNFSYMDNASSLGGLALFVGSESHTVALPGTQFPWLEPNSIYFTDAIGSTHWIGNGDDPPFGGHDIGIFNYQNKTVSSCYYPCDVQSIKTVLPKPVWFFPSSPI